MPGMRLSEALATCPGLVLVEPDPAAVELEWEALLRRLEDAGIAVEPGEPGVVTFETEGVERLYGGVEAALTRALASVGPAWDPRAGAGHRRFVALAAASVARAGQVVIVEGKEESAFLEPLPLSLLPLEAERYAELEGLGVRRLGELARLPGGAVAERLGQEGKQAWSLAHRRDHDGDDACRRRAPEACARAITCGRAGRGALLPRGGCERGDAAPGASRRCSTGSWPGPSGPGGRSASSRSRPGSSAAARGGARRRCATRRRTVAGCGWRSGRSSSRSRRPSSSCGSRRWSWPRTRASSSRSSSPQGEEADARLREGLRQVRASAGAGAVCAVVEVAPWSRIPEARAIIVPREI